MRIKVKCDVCADGMMVTWDKHNPIALLHGWDIKEMIREAEVIITDEWNTLGVRPLAIAAGGPLEDLFGEERLYYWLDFGAHDMRWMLEIEVTAEYNFNQRPWVYGNFGAGWSQRMFRGNLAWDEHDGIMRMGRGAFDGSAGSTYVVQALQGFFPDEDAHIGFVDGESLHIIPTNRDGSVELKEGEEVEVRDVFDQVKGKGVLSVAGTEWSVGELVFREKRAMWNGIVWVD